MLKFERLVIYPLLAVLSYAMFFDGGFGRIAEAKDAETIGRFTKVITQELVVAQKDGRPAVVASARKDGGALFVMNAKGQDAAELSARNGFGFLGMWAPPVKHARVEIFAGSIGGHAHYPAHIRLFDGAIYVSNDDKSREALLLPGLLEVRRKDKVVVRLPRSK